MSAALQFQGIALAAAAQPNWPRTSRNGAKADLTASAGPPEIKDNPTPVTTLAFYRKQTENLLRRYLYASMLVSRSPSVLTEPILRGRSSNRRVDAFEDCVIFVLDMEKSLNRLSALQRLLINRIVLQEYTLAETALLLYRSRRFIITHYGDAIDRLTEILLESATLQLPHLKVRISGESPGCEE